jgi:hypothetical protein
MKLRLGPLPSKETVKVTVTLPAELKERLEAYAELHSHIWGEKTDAIELIPHMLTQFILRDKAFKAALRSKSGSASALQTRDES